MENQMTQTLPNENEGQIKQYQHDHSTLCEYVVGFCESRRCGLIPVYPSRRLLLKVHPSEGEGTDVQVTTSMIRLLAVISSGFVTDYLSSARYIGLVKKMGLHQ